jgi:hypothetical protein
MPITFETDQRLKLVRTAVSGVISVQEILDHLTIQQRLKTVSWRELVDVRGVMPPYLSKSEIWQAAQRALAVVLEESAGPRAVLVMHPTVFGQCRMFATLVEDSFPIRVFRDLELAEHWLLEEYQIDSSCGSGADSGA